MNDDEQREKRFVRDIVGWNQIDATSSASEEMDSTRSDESFFSFLFHFEVSSWERKEDSFWIHCTFSSSIIGEENIWTMSFRNDSSRFLLWVSWLWQCLWASWIDWNTSLTSIQFNKRKDVDWSPFDSSMCRTEHQSKRLFSEIEEKTLSLYHVTDSLRFSSVWLILSVQYKAEKRNLERLANDVFLEVFEYLAVEFLQFVTFLNWILVSMFIWSFPSEFLLWLFTARRKTISICSSLLVGLSLSLSLSIRSFTFAEHRESKLGLTILRFVLDFPDLLRLVRCTADLRHVTLRRWSLQWTFVWVNLLKHWPNLCFSIFLKWVKKENDALCKYSPV